MEEHIGAILKAWTATVNYIADGHSGEFAGRHKERLVIQHVKRLVEAQGSRLHPSQEVPFNDWKIDLMVPFENGGIAVEGKFKIRSDGAVPDNRKAAFFDLFKLEQYISSGRFQRGLFLWLTDEPAYFRIAGGDSADFSTHHGRRYERGTPLNAQRSRSPMPLPLVLANDYEFKWTTISASGWNAVTIEVRK